MSASPGLTKASFNKPIPVQCTMRERTIVDGRVEVVEKVAIFSLNREAQAEKNSVVVAAALFDDASNFERFVKQLASEPMGFDDFPNDERPLEERAREYFSDGNYKDLIKFVVMEFDRAQHPVELFRGL